MAEEILNKSEINCATIKSVMDLLGRPCGSIMVASDCRAHELSGNFICKEIKNGKAIKRSDGINPAYLSRVLDGDEDGVIVLRKASMNRIDMGLFRPKNTELSGVFYADDPGVLSGDFMSWYFIQGQHADPIGTRYQPLSAVFNSLSGIERDRIYLPDEITNAALSYFNEECEKNGKYVDDMISAGRIKTVDKRFTNGITPSTSTRR